jgi:hypothetical protein
MARIASFIVVLALMTPPVATVLCELLVCAEAHHAAAADQNDCHGTDSASERPAWSARAGGCHDPAGTLTAIVVPLGLTAAVAPPPALPRVPSVAPKVLRVALPARSRSGPSDSLLAHGHLRI